MRNQMLPVIAAMMVLATAGACTKTDNGDVVIKRPEISVKTTEDTVKTPTFTTKTDTVNSPVVGTQKETLIVNKPVVGTEKKVVKVPQVQRP